MNLDDPKSQTTVEYISKQRPLQVVGVEFKLDNGRKLIIPMGHLPEVRPGDTLHIEWTYPKLEDLTS